MMELNPADRSSMKNVYESKHLNTVKQDTYERGGEMYKKSKNYMKTGVVPMPADSSMFSPLGMTDTTTGTQNNNQEFVSLLSGETLNLKQFQHNNMQPFIKGNVTQNTNMEQFTQRLDMNTGVDKLYRKKQEVENINRPIMGLHNINGGKQNSDFLMNRAVSEISPIRNNTIPFEQTRVGPGLNQGFTDRGSGGFHQANTNDFAKPKTLDELRSKVNQRDTYFEIPFKAPAKGTEQRAIATPFKKNKPEKTYSQTEDNWFKTTGSVLKDTQRPELAMKHTHRPELHKEYTGGAKIDYVQGMSLNDDLGKSSIIVYNNERQETQTRTSVSNITSTVKAIVSPIMDALKLTVKEYMVDATRAGGNPSAQIPKKLSVHDPNDLMKTTVKETTVHDSEVLNLSGPDTTYSASQDLAKTTVKETMIHDSDHLNIKTQNKGMYLKTDENAKTTIKETLPVIDTTRNIGKSVFKVYMYNPESVAKKTVKETTIKGTAELGFIGGVLNGILGGYATSDVEVRNTHKQFTVDNEEYGIAKSIHDHRQVSRDAEENAEFDPTREEMLIAAGHTPNAGRMNIPIDKSDIAMKTNKLINDSYSARNSGNVNVIYQQSPEIDDCGITREPDDNNAYENRLDGGLLSQLVNNDLSININPIHNIAK